VRSEECCSPTRVASLSNIVLCTPEEAEKEVVEAMSVPRKEGMWEEDEGKHTHSTRKL